MISTRIRLSENKARMRKAIADEMLGVIVSPGVGTCGSNKPKSKVHSREYMDAISSLEQKGCHRASLIAVSQLYRRA